MKETCKKYKQRMWTEDEGGLMPLCEQPTTGQAMRKRMVDALHERPTQGQYDYDKPTRGTNLQDVNPGKKQTGQ